MVKKKNGKLTMRGFRPIAMLPTLFRIYWKTLQQLAGGALHDVVWWMLRGVIEQATEVANSSVCNGLRRGSCIRPPIAP